MTVAIPLFMVALLAPQINAQTPIEWEKVDRALGRSGTLQGQTYRVGFPRNDLHVTVGAVTVRPALALGSWVAFTETGDSTAMLMGDLVLLPAEVGPVIDALQSGGVTQTALHNHLAGEAPHIVYLHIGGRGRPEALATAVHTALTRTRTPLGAPAPAATPAPALELDTLQIAQTLGAHGKVNGGVYQVSVPRSEAVMVDSVTLPPAMGVATAINFQATGAGRAAATGDFVLIASEVNPVIRALRASGIAVTALHSHLLDETPRLLFMHFWGAGDAVQLAKGLRAALDVMNIKRP
ncbi:MAG: peptidase M23 [Gemmatimonadetes bacterium]|nr:MAG: peptidase M23 [Gemmatimonadota bacterium]